MGEVYVKTLLPLTFYFITLGEFILGALREKGKSILTG